MESIKRKPKEKELRLIELLVHNSAIVLPDNWRENLIVYQWTMEVWEVCICSQITKNLKRGLSMLQCPKHQFFDKDGVEVFVSLNVDERGNYLSLIFGKLILAN